MSEEKKKSLRGRPSKYDEAMLDKAKLYVTGGFEMAGDVVPTIAGLACYLKISRETCHVWGREKKDFSDMLDDLLAKQERLLANQSLVGNFNPTISKLMLAKHGYTEKQEIDHQTMGQPIQSIERIIVKPKGE